jgi:hypothetical protein
MEVADRFTAARSMEDLPLAEGSADLAFRVLGA